MKRVTLRDRTVELDGGCVVTLSGSIHLSKLEARLVGYLGARAGLVVTRDELSRDVWGTEFGVESRAIDTTIRRLRSKLEADPGHPVHLRSIYGVGYRFDPEPEDDVVTAPLDDDLPRPGPLFGRTSLLEALTSAVLGSERAMILTGPAGVGKSHLALSVAMRVREDARRISVHLCDLAAIHSRGGLIARLAMTLGLRPDASAIASEPTAWLVRHLARRGTLLIVLDNAEALDLDARHALSDLSSGAPELRLLLTSRVASEDHGIRCIAVPPLDASDALALFRARAPRDPHLRGSEPDAQDAALDALIGRLDGLPLAIELAAARAALLTPQQILDRIDERFALLRNPLVTGDARHGSLQLALDISWDLLDPIDKSALSQCAIFRGSFTLDDAEAVLMLESGSTTLDALHRLRSHSLVAIDPPARHAGRLPGVAHYRLLDSVRDYAHAKLALDVTLLEGASARHRRCFVALAEATVSAIQASADHDALLRLMASSGDLQAIMTAVIGSMGAASVPTAQIGDAASVGLALATLEHAMGGLAAREPGEPICPTSAAGACPSWCTPCLSRRAFVLAEASGDDALVAGGHLALGMTKYLFAARATAKADVDEGVARARRAGDSELLARALLQAGVVAEAVTGLDGARSALDEALSLFLQSGHAAGAARAESLLAWANVCHGERAEALRWSRRALSRYRSLGVSRGRAIALHNHGVLALDLGLAEAQRVLEQSLGMYQQVGYPLGEATASRFLAVTELLNLMPTRALERVQVSIAIEEASGHERNLAFSRLVRGIARAFDGAFEEAVDDLESAEASADIFDDSELLTRALAFRALVHLCRKEREAAQDALDAAMRATAARRNAPVLLNVVADALEPEPRLSSAVRDDSWDSRLAAQLAARTRAAAARRAESRSTPTRRPTSA